MKRRLLNLLTVLSLLLCVAVCVLWVRSYWVFSEATYHIGRSFERLYDVRYKTDSIELAVDCGTFYAEHSWELCDRVVGRPPLYTEGHHWDWFEYHGRSGGDSYADRAWDLQWGGFGVRRASDGFNGLTLGVTRVGMPAWALAVGFATAPLITVTRRRRRGWQRRGRCAACGYDLRATPDRCPECGTIAAAPPAA
jgi:hypothetical protein